MSNTPESRGRLLGRPSNNEADFNKYRETITRLWSVENRTLKEVIGYMKTQYKFSATYEFQLPKKVKVRSMF